MRRKRILGIMMAVSLLAVATCGSYTYAGSVEEIEREQEKARERSEEIRGQQEEAQEQADQLEAAKERLKDALGDLDSDLQKVSRSMVEIEDQIAEKEESIRQTQEKLDAAQAAAEAQYEDMKLRIQYMYENSNTGVFTMLLESESVADLLNRVNYISELSDYDREKLEDYEETMQKIASGKTLLEEEKGELDERQQELSVREDELYESIGRTQTKLESAEDEERAQQEKLAALEEKLVAMESYEEELERRKAAAAEEEQRRQEAASQQQEQEQGASGQKQISGEEAKSASNAGSGSTGDKAAEASDKGGSSSGKDSSGGSSTGDLTLLSALIYCEAGGESYDGQLAVGTVVMNRIESSEFPDTLAGVIYQKGQFTPAASGKLALALDNNLATESCKRAAREVLSGTRTGTWLYFCMDYGRINGTVIDHQVFY